MGGQGVEGVAEEECAISTVKKVGPAGIFEIKLFRASIRNNND